jgi:hypothetical protein
VTEVIDDKDLERFLEPLLAEWNRLARDKLSIAAMRDRSAGKGHESTLTNGGLSARRSGRADPRLNSLTG